MANVSAFTGAMPVIPGGTVELAALHGSASGVNATYGTGFSTGAWLTDAVTFVTDGSPLLVEYFNATFYSDSASNQVIVGFGYDGSDPTSNRGFFAPSASGAAYRTTAYVADRVTLSAGSHTVRPKAYKTINSGTTGFGGDYRFLRVSKIVNQNDGLKPFWTPPVVTQLPSQATVGDQVIYAADATNGVYWHLTYDGLGTYPWKFIGGSPLTEEVGPAGYQNTNSTSYTDLGTVGPSVTVPVAGDYIVTINGQIQTQGGYAAYMSYQIGSTAADDYDGLIQYGLGNTTEAAGSRTKRKNAIAANTLIRAKYKVNAVANTGYFASCNLVVTPVRVKAA